MDNYNLVATKYLLRFLHCVYLSYNKERKNVIKKLSKHGNSLAILIDKPILDLLNMNEHTYINIKTDGTNIIIEPVQASSAVSTITDDSKLQELYEELVNKYDAVLKKLSK